ncbi:hypothetical protein PV328_001263 [Microctonus aethiopoides]|uniref:Uncharacterized protein n=1 Tax=Microctonus aethiopoides TaxID=144406 RepID=A0AA39FX21_9HYME|nr:hypothetical protein PV328_001263 [Microctonus aethiopoides]
MDEEVRNLLTAWNLESYIEVFKGSSSDKSNPPSPSLRLPERYISQEEEIPDAIVWLKIPELSISQYFEEYPALKKSTGYVLLEKDFDELYGGTYTEIFESFPPLKENIFKLAKKKSAHNKDSTLNELLNLQDYTVEFDDHYYTYHVKTTDRIASCTVFYESLLSPIPNAKSVLLDGKQTLFSSNPVNWLKKPSNIAGATK